ncbi:MAG: alpha/beta fold hydrolase [Candidatus Eremiobacteraeota bacterium]|nr:alpha/beta fold hydrolase [Candidatus Eremiobacteraeota bacterium]
MQRIAIDGGALAYAESGSGTPLVLVHGFLLDHSIWDDVAAALASRGRIVRPDLRGLGASHATPSGTTLIETLASDLAALLDALGVERGTFAGHSLGGYVALAFYRMYRERVEALALVGSRVGAPSPQAAGEMLELADRVEREGIGPLVEWFLPRSFAPSVYDKNPALVERVRALMARTDPASAAAILRGMAVRVDSSDLLEEIDVPFLCALGDQDALVGRAETEATVRAVRGGELALFEGVGHLPMLEEPDRLGVTLATFFGREARGQLA